MRNLRWCPRLLAPVAAAILLSACGNRFLAPAAVVDGREISQDALKTELDLALTDPQLAQQAAAGGDAKAGLTRQVLAALIRQEVEREYADARRIVVTPADIDQELKNTITQIGGQAAFDRIVQSRGFTPAQIRHILEGQVLLRKVKEDVLARLPNAPASDPQARDLAFQQWLSDRIAHAVVSVNPRFGTFDTRTGDVARITSTADLG